MPRTVLVAGASGITGSYIANALKADSANTVITLARSGDADLHADLTDPKSVAKLSEQVAPVTHVFYSAFAGGGPGKDWGALTDVNTAMFTNLLDMLEESCPSLTRIILMQGQKYYGTHLGAFKTPAKETDPRHAGQNFYFTQQDLLAERSQQADWDYLCLRPHLVCGHNARAPQNPVMVLTHYALLSKRAGLSLNYPGHPDAFTRITQATDANLLAKAGIWALDADAGGEGFNIINGDYFRWQQMWSVLADVFDMPVGEVDHQDLTRTMPPLAETHLAGVSGPDWGFANYMLGCTWDVMACTIKSRRYGFDAFCDSEQMYRALFEQARDRLEAA